MNKLYKFHWDCGRMGYLDGLFVAEESDVQRLVGRYVYFGEVLGKHSEVSGTISESDFVVVDDDQEKIAWLVGLLGHSVSGYNPFDYIEEDVEEDE